MLFHGVCHQILPPQRAPCSPRSISLLQNLKVFLQKTDGYVADWDPSSICCKGGGVLLKRLERISWRLRNLMKFQNEINFKLHTCDSYLCFFWKTLESTRSCMRKRCKKCNKTKNFNNSGCCWILNWPGAFTFCRCFSKVDNNRGVLAVSNDDGLYLRLCHHNDGLVIWGGISCFKKMIQYIHCIYIYLYQSYLSLVL